MFIEEGGVKLSVVNESGKEAVLAILGPNDFFGEGCLAGQSICMATATAIAPTTVLVIEKDKMIRLLHDKNEFSDRFINYMLERNLRAEEDLIDQLFNSSEKRLARTLLLLARYGALQHTISNPVIEIDADAATLRCNFHAVNVHGDPGRMGGSDHATVGGIYDVTLRREDGRWRLVTVNTIFVWTAGELAHG